MIQNYILLVRVEAGKLNYFSVLEVWLPFYTYTCVSNFLIFSETVTGLKVFIFQKFICMAGNLCY